MTLAETIVSVGATGAVGVIVWIIKDKQKSDLDIFKETIKTLKEELTDKKTALKEATDKTEAVEKEKKEETKLKDDCLKRVHELEISQQKKENEITVLKSKIGGDKSDNY